MLRFRFIKWLLVCFAVVLMTACGGGSGTPVADTDTMVVAFVDGEHEYEPWITNGTEAGTKLLKDINTRPGGSRYKDFTQVGASIYFIERFAMFSALWKTDGTDSGTVLVKKLPSGAKNLMEAGGSLYFVIKDSSNTRKTELWTSDGTEAGTKAIKVVESAKRPEISGMASMSGKLFFLITDYLYDIELWESSGTEATTAIVKDVWSGHDGSGGAYGNSLTVSNDKLYFIGYSDTTGREPWVSDGTEGATTILKDIFVGAPSSSSHSFIELNSHIYFVSRNDSRSEVWTTNGTGASTGIYGGNDTAPSSLAWFGGKLHYANSTKKIYKTSGPALLETEAVTDSMSHSPNDLLVIGTLLYFTVANTELWVTDGTFQGEIKLSDSIHGSSMTSLGGKLYFSSTDATNGSELWESDGTIAGTKLLKDIYDGTSSSNPKSMTNLGGALYLTADDGVHGNEIWKSDGTEGGTNILKDIVQSTLSSTFIGHAKPIQVEGSHYFIASDSGMGLNQFWKSDGTPAGTTMLKVLSVTQNTYTPPVDLNGTMYFSSSSFSTLARSIWISDGTITGTKKLIDNISGESFTRANGINYFVADGTQLWKTNGTTAGTGEIRAGIEMCSDERNKLVSFNHKVYFAGDDGGAAGCELYESDGTAAGTKIAGDLKVGAGDSKPKQFTVVGDKLYFVTEDGPFHILWVSDGTDRHTKTILAHDIYALVKADDKLYFSRNDELWITDGTMVNTILVKDINPGIATYSLYDHVFVDNKLFFTADDGIHGRELWVSDGTAGGANMVLETQDDNYDDSIVIYGGLNGKVLFHTIDASAAKLWMSDGTAGGTSVITENSVTRYGE